MAKYITPAVTPLLENGTLDEKDHWGITFYNIRDYLIYCETPYCTIDESGLPEISLFTDRFVDVYQTIFNTMWTHNYSRQFAPDMLVDVFAEDRSMFLQAPLRYSELFRGMEYLAVTHDIAAYGGKMTILYDN